MREKTKSKILLVSINQCAEPYPVFPLGLAHVDAALRQAGYVTEWFDYQVDREPIAQLISRVQPDFIGISVRNIDDVVIKKRETFFGQLLALVRELRELTARPVILGGSGFSIFPERLLELSGADFGIQGEAERSLPSLIRALASDTPYSEIPGLVFRRAGRVVMNPQSALAPDEILFAERPARLADFYAAQSSMLNVQTQRGCAFHCCYCTYPLIEGRRHRRRPPTAVVDELQDLESRGARYVFIVDSVFNSSAEHAGGICEEILRRDIHLRWGCFLRPKNLTPKLMRLMARAGLAHIEFGSDSFCDSVLEAYGKRICFDDIRHSSELARKAGVDFCHFLICGGPGETAATLQTSFQNSLRLQDAVILALVGMRVYPGTRLHKRLLCANEPGVSQDFLEPFYHLAPGLTEEGIFDHLRQFSARSPNWIVGDVSPAYLGMAERLRAKGIAGPLWSYFAMMQRLGDLRWRP